MEGPLPKKATRCLFGVKILVTSPLSGIICQLAEEQSDASTLLSFAVQKVPLVSFQNVTVWKHLLLHLQLHIIVCVENPAAVKSPYIDKSCTRVLYEMVKWLGCLAAGRLWMRCLLRSWPVDWSAVRAYATDVYTHTRVHAAVIYRV